MRTFSLAAFTLAFAGIAGCTADEAPVQVERDGVLYDLLETDDPASSEVAAALTTGASADLRGLSREHLAEALRPVLGHPNGHLYIARDKNYAAADQVRRGDGAEQRIEPTLRTRQRAGTMTQASIINGTDERVQPANTVNAPYGAIAKLTVWANPDGTDYRATCTGAYIGPWTFVTAAHCVRFADGAIGRRFVFEPGRMGASLPLGSFDCRNGDASTSNDIYYSFPAGYTVAGEQFDYAVIDTFPCHQAPRWFNGFGTNSAEAIQTQFGYPSGTCPGASQPGTFQCGMSGHTSWNGWRFESIDLDTGSRFGAGTDGDGGEHGAPWFTQSSGWWVNGIDLGVRHYSDFGRCGFDECWRNYAQRIDDGFRSFIQLIAFDF